MGRRLVVGHRVEPLDLGARLRELRPEQQRVRLVDLAGPERLAGCAKLGAGRKQRDPRPARAVDRRQPHGGKCSDDPRRDSRPRRGNHVPGGDVAAAGPYVVTEGNGFDLDDLA